MKGASACIRYIIYVVVYICNITGMYSKDTFITVFLTFRWGFTEYYYIGKRLEVNWKRANFIKLHILSSKHKLNIYNEYLTQSVDCVAMLC